MTRAALLVCARALMLALVTLVVVLGVLGLVGAVEPGAGPSLRALAALLGPAALAGAGAATLSIERREGRWAGWQTMGREPRSLLLPLLAVVVVGGWSQLSGSEPIAPLPPPIAVDTPAWWDSASQRWGEVPALAWQQAPHQLDLGALMERARKKAPAGARQSVDHGELVRRFGLALAWLVAFLSAVRATPAGPRSDRPALRDGATAAGLVLAWQVLVILGAAWVAAP
jgi:hypothetical protein